jgi:predicted nucleic acid-binding protein
VRTVTTGQDNTLDRLHRGEREAIILAEQSRADLIVLDEKAARVVAAQRGLKVTGLLGIPGEGARRGLIHLPTAVDRLRLTTFRASPRILKQLLDRHQESNN